MKLNTKNMASVLTSDILIKRDIGKLELSNMQKHLQLVTWFVDSVNDMPTMLKCIEQTLNGMPAGTIKIGEKNKNYKDISKASFKKAWNKAIKDYKEFAAKYKGKVLSFKMDKPSIKKDENTKTLTDRIASLLENEKVPIDSDGIDAIMATIYGESARHELATKEAKEKFEKDVERKDIQHKIRQYMNDGMTVEIAVNAVQSIYNKYTIEAIADLAIIEGEKQA
jgi:hypothetical protein